MTGGPPEGGNDTVKGRWARQNKAKKEKKIRRRAEKTFDPDGEEERARQREQLQYMAMTRRVIREEMQGLRDEIAEEMHRGKGKKGEGKGGKKGKKGGKKGGKGGN